MMRFKGFAFLVLLAGLMAAGSFPRSEASAADAPRSLTLFFTGFVAGNFSPCGCEAGPSGGLARLSGYSQAYALKSGDYVLHVDLGNYFLPPGPNAETVNKLMVEGLRRLPVEVVNLTPDDLYFWGDLAATDVGSRMISTNLRPRRASVPAPKSHAVITLSAKDLGLDRDLKIGFLGISDPQTVKPNSGFVGIDPLKAIAEAEKELDGTVDFVVVLADLDLGPGPFAPDSLPARIAEAHDNIYAVLVAERRYLLRTPLQVNNAVLLSSVERGRHLGRLTLGLDAAGNVVSARPEFTELGSNVPADPYFLRRQQQVEGLLPDPPGY